MKSVEERLAEYRREVTADDNKIPNDNKTCKEQIKGSDSLFAKFSIFGKFRNILLKPIHLLSCLYRRWPISSLVFATLSWLLAQWYFIYIEFGLVFFVFSLLVFLITNLGKRKPGELSAYSVFNPYCKRLPGTLTAEQLERDLLRREVLYH
uniref:SAYSvFN domain-containing protein n=1 Tax=Setaria digitata TaxID=48799 RepID=A0A915PYA0_9BILA